MGTLMFPRVLVTLRMVNGPVAAWVLTYMTLMLVPRYLHIRPVAVILAVMHTLALPPILPS